MISFFLYCGCKILPPITCLPDQWDGWQDAFIPVEQALREAFIKDLFQGRGEGTPGRGVTQLPVKQAGMALPDPTKTAPENWTASCVITGHLVAAIRGQEEFWTVDHSACLRKGRIAVQNQNVPLEEEALEETLAVDLVQVACWLWRATKMGELLTVQLTMENGTELGAQEWKYALFMPYDLNPPDIPHYCDGYNTTFYICHDLEWKRGGLVTSRHN